MGLQHARADRYLGIRGNRAIAGDDLVAIRAQENRVDIAGRRIDAGDRRGRARIDADGAVQCANARAPGIGGTQRQGEIATGVGCADDGAGSRVD